MLESHCHSPEFEAEVASHALSLRGTKLTLVLSFVTGTGFTLFGCVFNYLNLRVSLNECFSYDQGVMSSLLTARQVCLPKDKHSAALSPL